jgi:hypothetical protein
MDSTRPTVKLDWSRLLGFDQATPQETQAEASETGKRSPATLGSKIGMKKASGGGRGLAKLGAKIGTKGATGSLSRS